VPHIWVRKLVLHAGCLVIVAIRHSTNHNHESCIWQLWEVTSRFFTRTLSQIRRRSLVVLPSFLRCLQNVTCTFLQKHLNPLSLNPFGVINIFQRQSGFERLQIICNCCRPVQGSILQLFQPVLSPYYRPMLVLENPSHPYFLPLVEGTKVRLPHRFGKLLQGEFCLLQANWGFALGLTHVRRIIALIICIVLVTGNFW